MQLPPRTPPAEPPAGRTPTQAILDELKAGAIDVDEASRQIEALEQPGQAHEPAVTPALPGMRPIAPEAQRGAVDIDRTTAARVDETTPPSGVGMPQMPPPESVPAAPVDEPDLDGYEGEPVLVAGDGGFHVAELARLLALAGHETAISRGEADPILTNEVYGAVQRFRREAGIALEDNADSVTEWGRQVAVGPVTWAALKRAAATA
jgi:peptidoglycan hydrolase-like protein with peptidoglycan-binding domain